MKTYKKVIQMPKHCDRPEMFVHPYIALFPFPCVPADLDPPRFGPPSADLDPPTKLNENIILNVLVKMDDTLRSNAY